MISAIHQHELAIGMCIYIYMSPPSFPLRSKAYVAENS